MSKAFAWLQGNRFFGTNLFLIRLSKRYQCVDVLYSLLCLLRLIFLLRVQMFFVCIF